VDWDEDGDFDIICGESNGRVTFFKNTGSPTNHRFTNAGNIKANNIIIDVGNLSVPEINDWNEDGLKDLIMGCDAGYVYVYLNVGTNTDPVFATSYKINANGTAIHKIKNCPRIADMNEDGLKDLILSWIDGTCLYWPNIGSNAAPAFNDSYELRGYDNVLDPDVGAYNWSHQGVCDWNEDGHIDILYTRWESEIYVHLSGAHHLKCAVTPVKPPIIIPPSGGSFDYDLVLTNTSTHIVTLDVWTEITLPNGTPYGPVRIVGTNISIPALGTKKYSFKDSAPGSLPPSDDYRFAVYMGKMGQGYYVTDSVALSKKDYLSVDLTAIPESGGIVNFELNAEAAYANRQYILLGSISGTSPGTPLPGGVAVLPLNWDIFTNMVLSYANTPLFHGFIGVLDLKGSSNAELDLGPTPGFAGTHLYFAYALNKPYDFASNTVIVEITP